jgi:hypothetical protein
VPFVFELLVQFLVQAGSQLGKLANYSMAPQKFSAKKAAAIKVAAAELQIQSSVDEAMKILSADPALAAKVLVALE